MPFVPNSILSIEPRVSQKVINHRILTVLALLCLLLTTVDIILWSRFEDVEEALPRVAHLENAS
jgi:sensor domain CHASE-containing protein